MSIIKDNSYAHTHALQLVIKQAEPLSKQQALDILGEYPCKWIERARGKHRAYLLIDNRKINLPVHSDIMDAIKEQRKAATEQGLFEFARLLADAWGV